MTVCIVDYESGNLHSAAKAFERAVAEAGLNQKIMVTADADAVAKADRIVLPGVGAYADCKAGLAAVPGMVDAIAEAVRAKARPFLGICVGMQLMADRGLEHGVTHGFGWIGGEVAAIKPSDATLKIPHMGWNELTYSATRHPVLDGLDTGAHAYFVHSYAIRCTDPADVVAETDYGGPITAAVARDNMVGTQFHPEKSQATGLKLITNFLTWAP
ncbi:MAG: imidazole glycerol phosphate synthase subunit HisH [Rhodospirillaceae bacterium]